MRELDDKELGYISGGCAYEYRNKFELDVVECETVKAIAVPTFPQFDSHSKQINRDRVQLDSSVLSKQRSRY